MPRNPIKENKPQKQIRGEDIVNATTQKVVRIRDQDGNVQDIVVEAHNISPDETGRFIDSELINVFTDDAGNPLPQDPQNLIRSHSGLFISSQEQLARCTSFLHTSPNRNILLGQDGQTTSNGAICSRCAFWLNTIYIVLGFFGIGLLIGLFRASSYF